MNPSTAQPESTACIATRALFFAQLRDWVGADELTVTLPQGSTGRDLIRRLIQRHPKAEGLLEVSRLAVNREYVSTDASLRDGDEVAVIPPVSGG